MLGQQFQAFVANLPDSHIFCMPIISSTNFISSRKSTAILWEGKCEPKHSMLGKWSIAAKLNYPYTNFNLFPTWEQDNNIHVLNCYFSWPLHSASHGFLQTANIRWTQVKSYFQALYLEILFSPAYVVPIIYQTLKATSARKLSKHTMKILQIHSTSNVWDLKNF